MPFGKSKRSNIGDFWFGNAFQRQAYKYRKKTTPIYTKAPNILKLRLKSDHVLLLPTLLL